MPVVSCDDVSLSFSIESVLANECGIGGCNARQKSKNSVTQIDIKVVQVASPLLRSGLND